jgi:fatty-acid desaturase
VHTIVIQSMMYYNIFTYTIKEFFFGILLGYFISVCNTVYHHRYASHKAFSVNRVVGLALNIIGSIPIYNDCVWYASVHRPHHITCDTDEDPYGGVNKGLAYNVIGFLTDKKTYLYKKPADLLQNKELAINHYYFQYLYSWIFIPVFGFYINNYKIPLIAQVLSQTIVDGFGMVGHFIGEKNIQESKCEASTVVSIVLQN